MTLKRRKGNYRLNKGGSADLDLHLLRTAAPPHLLSSSAPLQLLNISMPHRLRIFSAPPHLLRIVSEFGSEKVQRSFGGAEKTHRR